MRPPGLEAEAADLFESAERAYVSQGHSGVPTHEEANAILYSQAISLKRIADALENLVGAYRPDLHRTGE